MAEETSNVVDPDRARSPEPRRGLLFRWWREPLLHFVLLGGLLFAAQAALTRDQHRVPISSALKAELAREIRERQGRPATPSQMHTALERWKQDEALAREARKDGLERDDPVIRRRLAEKLRATREKLYVAREPSEAELEQWLDSHRALYETPLRYDFERAFVAKSGPDAARRARDLLSKLQAGQSPLGAGDPFPAEAALVSQLPEQVQRRFGAVFAAHLAQLPVATWRLLETDTGFHAVRLNRVQGGLPPRDELRPRLVSDVLFAARERAVAREVEQIFSRYRFEEEP